MSEKPTMNEHLPALATQEEWQLMRDQARQAGIAGLLPQVGQRKMNVTEALVIGSYGKALGLTFFESVKQIYLVKGMPSMKAELMKALVHKKLPRAVFRLQSVTAEKCQIEVARDRSEEVRLYEITRKECDEAGYSMAWNYKAHKHETKDNWKKMPKDMLFWRLVSRVCRWEFPDCLGGLTYTPDELGADVDTVGQPVAQGERVSDELNAMVDAEWSEVGKAHRPEQSETQGH